MLGHEVLISPAFCYRIHPASVADIRALAVDGLILEAPGLTAEPGERVAVAAAACTLGSALQERIAQLFATRRRSLALALESVANQRLFRLADRAAAAIRREARRIGLQVGIEMSPGDAGLALEQQSVVLTLAGARAHGIAVAAAGMLTPVHSLSLLVALGPNLRRRSAASRCDACASRDRCAMN